VGGLLLLLLVMALFLVFWRRSQQRKAALINPEVKLNLNQRQNYELSNNTSLHFVIPYA
jgi:hypothetical protein